VIGDYLSELYDIENEIDGELGGLKEGDDGYEDLLDDKTDIEIVLEYVERCLDEGVQLDPKRMPRPDQYRRLADDLMGVYLKHIDWDKIMGAKK
jgi:hypothetical protein